MVRGTWLKSRTTDMKDDSDLNESSFSKKIFFVCQERRFDDMRNWWFENYDLIRRLSTCILIAKKLALNVNLIFYMRPTLMEQIIHWDYRSTNTRPDHQFFGRVNKPSFYIGIYILSFRKKFSLVFMHIYILVCMTSLFPL